MVHYKVVVLLYILIPLFSLSSCIEKGKSSINKNDIFIPDSIYSFYPQGESSYFTGSMFKETNSIINNRIETFAEGYYIEAYLPSSNYAYKKLLNKYEKEAIDSFSVESNKYFIITDEDYLLEKYTYNIAEIKYNNDSVNYLLPLFYNYTKYRHNTTDIDSLAFCGLPKDYQILIMKSGRNFILPENRKFNWSILPPKLKHGYTSGIAYRTINDMIIYWCVAW